MCLFSLFRCITENLVQLHTKIAYLPLPVMFDVVHCSHCKHFDSFRRYLCNHFENSILFVEIVVFYFHLRNHQSLLVSHASPHMLHLQTNNKTRKQAWIDFDRSSHLRLNLESFCARFASNDNTLTLKTKNKNRKMRINNDLNNTLSPLAISNSKSMR
jgi:hypothetical protein